MSYPHNSPDDPEHQESVPPQSYSSGWPGPRYDTKTPHHRPFEPGLRHPDPRLTPPPNGPYGPARVPSQTKDRQQRRAALAAAQLASSRKRAWLVSTLLGGGVALAMCCGSAALLEDPNNTSSADDSTHPPAAIAGAPRTLDPDSPDRSRDRAGAADEQTYKADEPISGGPFEFTVNGVMCGILKVGNTVRNKAPKGQYCRVSLSLSNVSNESLEFAADRSILAYDQASRQYEPDGKANIYGNNDGAGFLDAISPGKSIRAHVYFDLPKGARVTKVTLDAESFSLAKDAVVTL